MPIGVARDLTVQPDVVNRAELPRPIELRQSLFTSHGGPETVGIVYRMLSNFRFQVGNALFTAVTRTETVSGTQQDPTPLRHQLVLAAGPDAPKGFAVIRQEITEPDGHRREDEIVILVQGGA